MATYTIESGDTFDEIAEKHGCSAEEIEAANPGVDPTDLQIGATIHLPGSAPPASNQPAPSGDLPGGTGGSQGRGGYEEYSGPASNFPDPAQWAEYDVLWEHNSQLMKAHDSDEEIALIKTAIETVALEAGFDVRAILCIVMQESHGDVRVVSTNNGVNNPGIVSLHKQHHSSTHICPSTSSHHPFPAILPASHLSLPTCTNHPVPPKQMQSHNGTSFNPADAAGSILQMARDGVQGTQSGDGLVQLRTRYGGNYYEAFRAYNSGSVNTNDLNDRMGATASYVCDVANRLTGHVWEGM